MTLMSLMNTCKIALCTPKAKYNNPRDELPDACTKASSKDSARWRHAVYLCTLSTEFMGELVRSDSCPQLALFTSTLLSCEGTIASDWQEVNKQEFSRWGTRPPFYEDICCYDSWI